MIVALDTETTGLTLHHGCLPFFVSTCDEGGTIRYWEWRVDPKTRIPKIPKRDVREIRKLILDPKTTLVLHNAKFDIRALQKAGIISFQEATKILSHCDDTLIASHCLFSAESHKLKDLAIRFLDIDDTDQRELGSITTQARRIGKRHGWRIAGPSDPHWPHLERAPKSGWGAFDTWLPRAVCRLAPRAGILQDAETFGDWEGCLRKYAILDAERTIGLWLLFHRGLKEEGLWVYNIRKRLLPITYRMEEYGITLQSENLREAIKTYRREERRAETACIRGADHKIDNLRSYPQLQGVIFGTFRLKPSREHRTKTGYSTGADAVKEIALQVEPDSIPGKFLSNLQKFRQYGKAVDYLNSYSRVATQNPLRLHPNYNITGTATTRFSSNDPNAQNISERDTVNLRRVFGPAPGRVWYAFDYANIELRIFAYQAGDKRLIEAFERGLSVHLVIAEQLHPELYGRLGPERFKKRQEYRSTKNGNFSLIYGAGPARANATYGVTNAYQRIRKQFPLIDKFLEAKNAEAKRQGYVTTLGGYRLQVPRDKPHAAVNYFVQGSAGWAILLAMTHIDPYLRTLKDCHLIMQIHDELIFDFPACARSNRRKTQRNRQLREIKRLMEQSGEDIGVPLLVDAEAIHTDWSNGIPLEL